MPVYPVDGQCCMSPGPNRRSIWDTLEGMPIHHRAPFHTPVTPLRRLEADLDHCSAEAPVLSTVPLLCHPHLRFPSVYDSVRNLHSQQSLSPSTAGAGRCVRAITSCPSTAPVRSTAPCWKPHSCWPAPPITSSWRSCPRTTPGCPTNRRTAVSKAEDYGDSQGVYLSRTQLCVPTSPTEV